MNVNVNVDMDMGMGMGMNVDMDMDKDMDMDIDMDTKNDLVRHAHGLLRSSLISGGVVVGRRRVDVCSAEGVQAAAASLQRQESLGDGASPRSFLSQTRHRRARLIIPVRASPVRRMLMRHRRLRGRLGSRRRAQRAARGAMLRDELGKGGTAVPPLCSAW